MLSYKTIGAGKPLLLIHGFGISFGIWRNLAEFLRHNFKLIVIELPGIGKSGIKLQKNGNYYDYCSSQIDLLRQKLKIKKWAVISYSVGARVAENYMNTYGQFVSGGVFIFPLLINKNKAGLLKKLNYFDEKFPKFGNWILSGWRLSFLITALGFNGKTNPEVKNWHYWISSQPVSTLKMTLKHLPDFGVAEFNILNIPLLYIWAEKDVVIDKPKTIKSNYSFIESTHGGIISNAGEIAKVINVFLKEHPSF